MQNFAITSIIILLLTAIIVFLISSLRKKVNEIKEFKLQLEETKTILEIRIRSRTQELEELANGLDGQVKERTAELEEKIEDLEKIKRLSIGRELKMIELKKEIQDLKDKITILNSENGQEKAK